MEKITIRAFRAVDDHERCLLYMREHARVLEDIGVSSVIKPDEGWMRDPEVTVLVAEHPMHGMVAGIRLHSSWSSSPLPIEGTLCGIAPEASVLLNDLREEGMVEMCALWNAQRFAGRGVPYLLISAAAAVASQMSVKRVVTFIAEYVATYAAKSGFMLMEDLPERGVFVYPVPSIRTHAMVLDDIEGFKLAASETRKSLLSLRSRPLQSRTEMPKRTALTVNYQLVIDVHAEQAGQMRMDRAA